MQAEGHARTRTHTHTHTRTHTHTQQHTKADIMEIASFQLQLQPQPQLNMRLVMAMQTMRARRRICIRSRDGVGGAYRLGLRGRVDIAEAAERNQHCDQEQRGDRVRNQVDAVNAIRDGPPERPSAPR